MSTWRRKKRRTRPPDLRLHENLVNTCYANLSTWWNDTKLRNNSTQPIWRRKWRGRFKQWSNQMLLIKGGKRSIVPTTNPKRRSEWSNQSAIHGSGRKLSRYANSRGECGGTHQMFLDLALHTEQQWETLDQIEYQVGSAADHTEEGNTL